VVQTPDDDSAVDTEVEFAVELTEGEDWYASFDGPDTVAFLVALLAGAAALVGTLTRWGPEGFEYRSVFFDEGNFALIAMIVALLLIVLAYVTVEPWPAWAAATAIAVAVGIAATNIFDLYDVPGSSVAPTWGLWLLLISGVVAFAATVGLAIGLLDRIID